MLKLEKEVKMLEMLSLIVFAGICYLMLIVIPSVIEKVTSEEFKKSYIKFLSKPSLHSYGKSYF